MKDKKNEECALAYEVIGTGTPVLLLHGFSCDRNLMKGCMEPIFQNTGNFQRIYLDLPGMGESKAPLSDASSDCLLQTILDFVAEKISGKFLLIGESYGGYLSIGILTKLADQIHKVLLICPVVEPVHSRRKLPQKTNIAFDEEFLNTLSIEEREAFCTYAVIANKQTYDRYKKDIQVGMKKGDNVFLDALSQNYSFSFGMMAQLTKIHPEVPLLLLAGKQDNCVGYEDLYTLATSLPNASYFLLDRAGHNLQIEQPAIFDRVVGGWLEMPNN